MKKGATKCMDDPSKKKIEFLKNHHGNICLIFEISFYTFKFATTKYPWKFIMFQESFYMFKALKKSMWTCGFFFCFKCLFSLSNVHEIVSIFLWTLIYSTRRDPNVQNIQKIKIHIPIYIFDIRTSINIIIVLNL